MVVPLNVTLQTPLLVPGQKKKHPSLLLLDGKVKGNEKLVLTYSKILNQPPSQAWYRRFFRLLTHRKIKIISISFNEINKETTCYVQLNKVDRVWLQKNLNISQKALNKAGTDITDLIRSALDSGKDPAQPKVGRAKAASHSQLGKSSTLDLEFKKIMAEPRNPDNVKKLESLAKKGHFESKQKLALLLSLSNLMHFEISSKRYVSLAHKWQKQTAADLKQRLEENEPGAEHAAAVYYAELACINIHRNEKNCLEDAKIGKEYIKKALEIDPVNGKLNLHLALVNEAEARMRLELILNKKPKKDKTILLSESPKFQEFKACAEEGIQAYRIAAQSSDDAQARGRAKHNLVFWTFDKRYLTTRHAEIAKFDEIPNPHLTEEMGIKYLKQLPQYPLVVRILNAIKGNKTLRQVIEENEWNDEAYKLKQKVRFAAERRKAQTKI